MADESSSTTKRLVFVSHSGSDTWVAKQIAREIEARGATPFLDEGQVDAGADFEEDILDFLQRAHELVVLLTPWALERPYVWAEIGAAWGRRIPIVALLLGITAAELQVRPGIPVLLKKRDLLELNDIEVYFGAVSGPRAARRMTAMDKPKVFISHSALDADWARSFAQALKQRGVAVWFDEFDVHPGESLREALESGLRGSDVFVALLDAEYPAKPALFLELGAAIGMGKRVVPIVPKGLDPSNLPLDVRLRRYLVRDSPEHTAEELSNALLAA